MAASRPLPPPPAGSPHCLLQRQLQGARPSEQAHRWRSFSFFQIQRQWDLYAPQHPSGHWWPPFYLRRRSAVREVVATHGLVIALADSGVCAAFDQGRQRWLVAIEKKATVAPDPADVAVAACVHSSCRHPAAWQCLRSSLLLLPALAPSRTGQQQKMHA